MRKKLMSLLLTGVLATSLLTGCGSTDDNTAEGTATATATESKQETVDLANTEVAEKRQKLLMLILMPLVVMKKHFRKCMMHSTKNIPI